MSHNSSDISEWFQFYMIIFVYGQCVWMLGKIQRELGDFNNAHSILTKLLYKNNNDILSHCEKCLVYIDQGKIVESYKYYNNKIKNLKIINKSQSWYRNIIYSYILTLLNKNDQAQKLLKKLYKKKINFSYFICNKFSLIM